MNKDDIKYEVMVPDRNTLSAYVEFNQGLANKFISTKTGLKGGQYGVLIGNSDNDFLKSFVLYSDLD